MTPPFAPLLPLLSTAFVLSIFEPSSPWQTTRSVTISTIPPPLTLTESLNHPHPFAIPFAHRPLCFYRRSSHHACGHHWWFIALISRSNSQIREMAPLLLSTWQQLQPPKPSPYSSIILKSQGTPFKKQIGECNWYAVSVFECECCTSPIVAYTASMILSIWQQLHPSEPRPHTLMALKFQETGWEGRRG